VVLPYSFFALIFKYRKIFENTSAPTGRFAYVCQDVVSEKLDLFSKNNKYCFNKQVVLLDEFYE
jgi:hypothetical protein